MGGNAADFDFSQWFGGNSGFSQGGNIDLGDLFGGSSSGFSDFFNTVFGRRRGQTMNQQDAFGRQGQTATRDVEQRVDITLEEAYHGTERVLSQNGNRFTAKIPPGADTGTKIRLQGKGTLGPHGASDLLLVVQLKPHPTFTRAGADLQTTLPIDVLTAVLGGKITVPTLTGLVTLTIPAGTQGGQTFRLKGKGLPHLRRKHQFGDLLLTVNIRVPTELSPEEHKLYEQLAELAHLRSS
jgi:curved DNA-binding protein